MGRETPDIMRHPPASCKGFRPVVAQKGSAAEGSPAAEPVWTGAAGIPARPQGWRTDIPWSKTTSTGMFAADSRARSCWSCGLITPYPVMNSPTPA